jgi:hypothetical protein
MVVNGWLPSWAQALLAVWLMALAPWQVPVLVLVRLQVLVLQQRPVQPRAQVLRVLRQRALVWVLVL